MQLVVSQGMKLAISGLVLGLAIAAATTHFLSSLLFGISPTDPGTFAGIGLLMFTVAGFASLFPALRASGVDPMVALRYE